MVTKVSFILSNKNIRLNFASILLRKDIVHLINSANLLTDKKNLDFQTILFLKLLERHHLELFTQTIKLNHVKIGSNLLNVNLVMDAHSITMMKRKESLLTHSLICQKVLLFLQCQKNQRATKVKTITTIKNRIMTIIIKVVSQSAQTISVQFNHSL
jgi:hypothetical protein